MKKIILILLAIMFSFSCVFATTSEEYKQLQKDIEDADVNLKNNPNDPMMKLLKENAEKALDEAIKSDPNNLASSAFTIDTDSILPSIDMG
jgi:ABC-type transporter MlaC component